MSRASGCLPTPCLAACSSGYCLALAQLPGSRGAGKQKGAGRSARYCGCAGASDPTLVKLLFRGSVNSVVWAEVRSDEGG
jgi:hypothetical protein